MTARRTHHHLVLRVLLALLLGAAIVAAAIAVLVHLLAPSVAPVTIPPAQQCVATAGSYQDSLTLEQAGNAAIIAGVALQRGLPARAATIALVTAMQESGLRNLDYGDRDSIGLFQQRPSQGWGTQAQIMDPWYASGKFYDALVKVKGWQTGDINDVAQAVQRSGVPEGYRPHEGAGRAWASVLTGNTAGGLTCVDRGTTDPDADGLAALLHRIFGNALSTQAQGNTLTITAPDATTAWAVAQLGLADTGQAGVASVQVGHQRLVLDPMQLAAWITVDASSGPPATGTPSPDDLPLSDVQVRIMLR
ncbi:MAG: hypothetical protein FWF75_04685 [Propionibacteriaceae bacterium]|nr:hypothetical protein [Propionibacteriaceae bacterium]